MRAEFDPVTPVVVRMTRSEADAIYKCLEKTNEVMREQFFADKDVEGKLARDGAQALGELWTALDDLLGR
jgi:hypothetical protein